MYDGMHLYRGVVSYADSSAVYVVIPAFTGNSLPMKISDIMGVPNIEVGDQVVVAVEDSKAYNIHIISSNNEQTVVNGGSA